MRWYSISTLAVVACATQAPRPAPPVDEPAARSGAGTDVRRATVQTPWTRMEDAIPELLEFQRVPELDPPGWLGDDNTTELWVTTQAGCVRFIVHTRQFDGSVGEFEACRQKLDNGHVQCTYQATIARWLQSSLSIACQAEFGSTGKGMGRTASGDELSLGLIGSDNTQATYAETWELHVEPDEVVTVRQPCTAGTAERAAAAYRDAHPGATEQMVEKHLWRSHGVSNGHRSCRRHTGMKLRWRRVDTAAPGAHIPLDDRPEPADCSIPCPPSDVLGPIRAYNQLLGGEQFIRPASPRYRVYRDELTCQTAGDPFELPVYSELCWGDWLDR